jgi:hypothetical protein
MKMTGTMNTPHTLGPMKFRVVPKKLATNARSERHQKRRFSPFWRLRNHSEWQSIDQIYNVREVNVVLVNWLPVAGILSVAVSYLTILAAVLHIRRVRRATRGKYPPNLLPLQGEIFVGRMGLSGAVVTPLIFLTVWLAIILEAWSGH